MKAKYNDIRDRLQKHVEDRNGVGTYDLRGSILESDIIYFVEKEVNNVVSDAVIKCPMCGEYGEKGLDNRYYCNNCERDY